MVAEFCAPHRVPGARRAEGLSGVRAGADLEDIGASLDRLEVTDPSPGPRASQHCTAFITLGVGGALSYAISPTPVWQIEGSEEAIN